MRKSKLIQQRAIERRHLAKPYRNRLSTNRFSHLVWVLLNLIICYPGLVHGQGRQGAAHVTVRLHGIYDATVTLTPYEKGHFKTALAEIPQVKDDVRIEIPEAFLPGQFLLRMDYRQKVEDQPYPAEFVFFMNQDDLTLGINPLAVHPDSIDFGSDKENPAYFLFQQENSQRRQQLALLEQLLAGYDSRSGKFFKASIEEFKKRQIDYNQWISDQEKQHSDLFISSTFSFQKVPKTQWDLPMEQQVLEQGSHYFDEVNLSDSLILRTQAFNDFITTYMRMFGMQATTEELRDSLFTHAGRLACEKASQGHPEVYGWMVDYFYQGYETYAIASGMKMLEKHIQNPNCLTSKKQEILRRLEGMAKLTIGADAPAFEAEMMNEMQVRFTGVSKGKSYSLLVFYDSDCGHCTDLLQNLKSWHEKPENSAWVEVVTIALDEDREAWEKFHSHENFLWTDVWAPGGINSKAANDYYILASPVMFVIDKDQKILQMPESVTQLESFLNVD